MSTSNSNNQLCHWGVKGMRWGVRRYQNPDGTLTEAGKNRQAKQEYKSSVAKAKANYKKAKMSNKTPLSELEKYKRDQRVKNTIQNVLGGTAAIATAAAVAPAIMMSWGLIKAEMNG